MEITIKPENQAEFNEFCNALRSVDPDTAQIVAMAGKINFVGVSVKDCITVCNLPANP